jgi:hypothetical protein
MSQSKEREQRLFKLQDQLGTISSNCARIALESYPDWDDLKTVAGKLHELSTIVGKILAEVWRVEEEK